MARGPDRLNAAGRRPPPALTDPRAVDGALRAAVTQLDAVLAEQDRAATRILGLAELLLERAPDDAMRLRIEAIIESCAFQDISGQRVRKVRALLARLTTLAPGTLRVSETPIESPAAAPAGVDPAAEGGPGLTQEEVDRLLGK
ncbi:hypothetical protein [Roseospira goensis]|uniref:Chemotaxis protein CheZ n=1 Tax=Roseospira goensis TaxID=391922 RepID=A0A7W6WL88_9PROT|nr:hypothetical protein [Roseospira goensis]MBB4287161.1 hypothetical protein [Roseospira goensis]